MNSLYIGRWELLAIDGQELNEASISKGRPYMKLHKDGIIDGFGGCNSFHGSYTLDEDLISFGPMASTKMYCGEENRESDFFAHLQGTLMIELIEDALILKGDNQSLLNFKQNSEE